MAKAWHLTSRPQGLPTHDNFALRDLPDAPLEKDQLRVRNLWLSVDPYMRGRMNDAKSYAASFQIDQPMTGGAIGEVVESRMEGFAPGDLILHMRSEEHTSELQSLMRISYAVFCLKKKNKITMIKITNRTKTN